MAVSTYYNGKYGDVRIGTSTIVNVRNWKITHNVNEEDTTSTGSAGYGEVQPGIETVEGTFEAFYDTTNGPYALNLVPGTYVTNLKLAQGTAAATPVSTTQWVITSAFIKSVEPSVDVTDAVKYTVSFRSHGSFTKPTA